jgi:CDP-glycerol glycerophosphotransferase
MARPLRARARRALIDAAQAAQRTNPRLIFYNAFNGRFADSPRAIYEALRAADPSYSHVWRGRAADASAFPPGVRTVNAGSWPHARELAKARYLVTNVRITVPKPRNSTWVQTWHGTPLKRIGFDIVRKLSRDERRELTDDAARWDVLLSPNRFSTPIFRAAFGFDGPILETGLPRNDVLSSPDKEALREATRKRLGIDPGQQVVLYAPTWRDGINEPDSPPFDVGRVADALGEAGVLLLRFHRLHLNGPVQPVDERDPRVRDVTSYPDIRDLFLAADMLVTDYSSVMFDFAVTGKPMFFYLYDLESYRDELRGFYFDLEAEAPGPILRTEDELIAALRDAERAAADYAAAYERFRDKFCEFDDGHATQRVLESVFGIA